MIRDSKRHGPRLGALLLALTSGAIAATANQSAAAATIVLAANNGEAIANGDFSPAFSNPVLNEAGQAAFQGFGLGGAFGVPFEAGGVYIGDGVTPLRELASFGEPGLTPGSFAGGFSVAAVNDSGVVLYRQTDIAALGTDNVVGEAAVLNDGVAPRTIVVSTGDIDDGGDVVDSIRLVDIDANSRVGLVLTIDNDDSSRSTVLYDPSTGLRTLSKEDQPAPDGVGIVAGAFNPAINDAGQTFHSPRVDRPGFPERPVLFRETPGVGRETLFRSEDPTTLPNLDGTLLLEIYSPSMNETGRVALYGSISGAMDPANNGLGLFVVDTPGEVIAVVREGQPVPGGDTFTGFGRPSLNEAGDLAFYAQLTDDPNAAPDPENVGLYKNTSAGLTEIARDGQAVPGGDGTFDLRNFSSTSGLSLRPLFNDNGQVAFLTDLAGTTSGNDDAAIYMYDDILGLSEIARTGGPLLDSTIVELGLAQTFQNVGDSAIGFNDAGQIAYRFTLANGREGIALWSPTAVPEPASVVTLLIGTLALLMRGRRKLG